jgi:hypothetical protein
MTHEYELADNNRADLIFEKQDLLAPLGSGMAPPPHPMASGTTEQNYYAGEFDVPPQAGGGDVQ